MNKDMIKLVVVYIVLAFLAAGCGREKGDAGQTGAKGSSCSVSQTIDGALVSCTDGTSAVITDGAQGPQGVSGKDASPVTVVTFCDGDGSIAKYPDEFPEIGFCINGNIYGAYSANGGFAAYLPPGTYKSDGIGSSCTFTIGTDCTIAH